MRVLCVIAICCAPMLAWAQRDEKPVLTKFINMQEMLVNGRPAGASAVLIDARRKARFDRLFKLRKDVLPALRSTAADSALR